MQGISADSGPPAAKRRIDAAIAVIVGADRRILITQRKADDSFGGYWEFPGGAQEAGESLQACVVRELREELALTVRPVRQLSAHAHDYPDAIVYLHPFLCTIVSGEPTMIECQAFKWIAAHELPRFRFPPANGPLIAEIQRVLKAGGEMVSEIVFDPAPP